ncbi:Methylated-DNA--protein-cysteine methyltransferase [subsurface metagenome]
MQKVTRYVILKTKWGYFGLAGTEYGLYRTQLPGPKPEKIKVLLLKNLSAPNRVPRQSRDRKGAVIHGHQVSLVHRSFSEGGSIEFDKTFFKTLQEQIAAYFEGNCVNFSRDIPLALDGFSSFGISVLTTCRAIEFGQTITYGRLTKKSGRPNASRAVGSVLAKNPLPLLIPCHRVIRSDGKLGGFSAPGGVNLKKSLLLHEKNLF